VARPFGFPQGGVACGEGPLGIDRVSTSSEDSIRSDGIGGNLLAWARVRHGRDRQEIGGAAPFRYSIGARYT
jgi:hypothetical protein